MTWLDTTTGSDSGSTE